MWGSHPISVGEYADYYPISVGESPHFCGGVTPFLWGSHPISVGEYARIIFEIKWL
jgi:hypothetical protein